MLINKTNRIRMVLLVFIFKYSQSDEKKYFPLK